jgi:predicted outer membrane lipoprotein
VPVPSEILAAAHNGAFDRAAFRTAAPTELEERVTWYDKVAIAIARGYLDGRSDFNRADGAINDLWTEMLDDSARNAAFTVLPGFAYEIYDAFDAGEDARDAPIRITRPALEKILASPETVRAFDA